MQAVLTVLINPVPGRDEQFNDWYTHVHIRDVMRFAGSIRVQRLVAADLQVMTPSHRYFTLYDSFDPALLSRAHKDAMGTPRMVVTSNHDKANVINGYYYPVAARTRQPTLLTADGEALILEQIDVPRDKAEMLEDWYAGTRLPATVRSAGHVNGTLLRFDAASQMFVFEPRYSHIALYRTDDLAAALQAWRDPVVGTPLDGLARAISCYVPMAPYLTRDAVEQASAEALALEEGARHRALAEVATTEQLGIRWT